MAKIFDRMKDLMFGEYEDDDDYYEDDYDTAAPAPAPVRENYGLRDARETEYSAPAPRKAAPKNAANPQIYSVNTSVQMQVVIIKPECYEDAQEICDQIKTKRPVVVNLEKVEYPIAQRIMDFLSGTCYSLEGSIQRVANNIFIIGLKRSFSAACYLNYALQHLDCRSFLINGLGGMFDEQLNQVKEGDVVVAISFSPYAAETVNISKVCAKKGVKQISITDSQISPLLAFSDIAFVIKEAHRPQKAQYIK